VSGFRRNGEAGTGPNTRTRGSSKSSAQIWEVLPTALPLLSFQKSRLTTGEFVRLTQHQGQREGRLLNTLGSGAPVVVLSYLTSPIATPVITL
jgi:hypothetical protein